MTFMRNADKRESTNSAPELGQGDAEYQEISLRFSRPTIFDRIMTPFFVLVIFTALNFITYYDRGAIAGCLTKIREKGGLSANSPVLSDTESGLIFSCFMVGYMVSSPLFVWLGGTFASKWIIFAGMVVWAFACVGTGLSNSYAFILISRIFVGVGEAAFVGFSVTVVERIAPQNFRILWIGTFYSMIPVGTAVGMAVGGVVSSLDSITITDGWRLVFFTEVIVATPIVLAIAFFPSKYNMRQENDSYKYLSVYKAAILLLKNVDYVLIVLGYAMYCFVIGAVSVWAIPFLVRGPMELSTTTASLIMGGVTALTGVFGSIAGGVFMDILGGNRGKLGMMKVQLFITLMVALCVPLGIIALFMKHVWIFVLLLVLSVFALFAVTAPINAAILDVVSIELKAYAVSFSVFIIHLLGDLPSPVFTGFLSETFSKGCTRHNETSCLLDVGNQCQWVNKSSNGSQATCVNKTQLRSALLIVFSMLLLAIPCWMIVYFRLWRGYKRSLERSDDDGDSIVNNRAEN